MDATIQYNRIDMCNLWYLLPIRTQHHLMDYHCHFNAIKMFTFESNYHHLAPHSSRITLAHFNISHNMWAPNHLSLNLFLFYCTWNCLQIVQNHKLPKQTNPMKRSFNVNSSIIVSNMLEYINVYWWKLKSSHKAENLSEANALWQKMCMYL